MFSTGGPGPGGPFGSGNNNDDQPATGGNDGYISDEEGKSFESDKKFNNYILFGSAIALGMCLMASNVSQSKRLHEKKEKQLEVQQQQSSQKYTGKADIGGPWLLYDTKGQPVTHKDFEGKYYLIYFGFTYCPDVCPISLIKMSKAIEKVKESKEFRYFDLASIFVSVDPDRDSNERIDEYVKIFHEDMIGLTHKSNDQPELKNILKKFKIHVSKIYLSEEETQEDEKTLMENAPEVVEKMKTVKKTEKDRDDDKYTLDHSIIVYLIGPDNNFLTYLGSNLDEQAMADIILDEVSADIKRRVMPPKGQV